MFVLSAINARVMERFQAMRRVGDASNRTVNMDVGAAQGSEAVQTVAASRGRREDADGVWRRTCRPPLVTLEEQQPLFRTAEANPEWDHVDCAGILAAQYVNARRRSEACTRRADA